MRELLNIGTHYPFHFLSSASLFLSILSVLLAILIIDREGLNRAVVSFAIVCLGLAVWYGAYSPMYVAESARQALFYANIGHIGAAIVPVAVYTFTALMLDTWRPRLPMIMVGWLACVIFIDAQLQFGFIFDQVKAQSYGYYPLYNKPALVFILYAYSYVLLSIAECLKVILQGDKQSRYYRRTQLFLWAYVIASAAAIDTLAAWDFKIYPIGVLFIVEFVVIVAYTVCQYRLLTITPRLAVDEIIRTIPDPLIVSDANQSIKLVNPAACEIMGYRQDELINHPLTLLEQNDQNRLMDLVNGDSWKKFHEIELGTKTGERIDVSLALSPIKDPKVNSILGHVMIARDVRDYKKIQRRLWHMAEHDALTGAYNRRGFFSVVEKWIQEKQTDTGALILVDINKLKFINDSLGHRNGDEVLKSFYQFFNEYETAFDLVARVGGDEFALVIFNCPQIKVEKRVKALVAEIQNKPFDINNDSVHITICAGVGLYFHAVPELSDWLAQADRALSLAKSIGPNSTYFNNEEDFKAIQDELNIVYQVRERLNKNNLELWGQPIYDLNTGKLAYYELLLRMEDNQGVVQPPAYFLETATNYGMMGEINRFVVSKTLSLLNYFSKKGMDVSVAFNLGGSALADVEFHQYFDQKIKASGVAPQRITCEITENVVVTNLYYAISFIDYLHGIGVKVALDDFGVGTSSLNQIKTLPIDVIKVDGSFIKNLKQSTVDYTIVKSIAELAKILNIETVAEFVETQEIDNALKEMGFNYGQGYYYGRPRPLY